MPTFEKPPSVLAEYRRLDPAERTAFTKALRAFIQDLRRWERAGMAGKPRFRAELRVKDVEMRKGVWELTWRWPEGRATFQYGPPVVEGRVHVIWRRIGTHAILRNP